MKTIGELDDGGFFDGTDGDKGANFTADKFTSQIDHGGFFNLFDKIGHTVVFFDCAIGEITISVIIGDLANSLGAHLVATDGIGFGSSDIVVANISIQDVVEFLMDEVEEFGRAFQVDFAVKVPGGIMPAVGKVTAHAVNETIFTGLTEDFAAHGAIQNMIETVHSIDFAGFEFARGEPSEGESDIGSVFATDEDWSG